MTPWTAALQAPLSFIISQSLLRFITNELVMLPNIVVYTCQSQSFNLPHLPFHLSPWYSYICSLCLSQPSVVSWQRRAKSKTISLCTIGWQFWWKPLVSCPDPFQAGCTSLYVYLLQGIGPWLMGITSPQHTCSHVWMWELDYKESWVLKSWCFWTVVLEKTLESPLDC